MGTQFADYFTEREVARTGVKQTFDMGVVTEYALTMVARTRRHLQVTFNASVFKDAGGTARGIFASVRDVTDRVRLEEQMREQQAYLRGLIESSGDGLVTVDPEGFITDLNEQMCRMTGYARQELMGSVFKRYFTQPDNAEMGVRRTPAEGGVTNYELVLESKGGRKAAVSFNASVFRAPDGHIEGIFASMRDISEKARLETQLTEQQVYNRSLFEASADALFAIAPDGIITDVNEEAIRISGYTRKHLISSSFNDYFTDPRQAAAGVAKTFAEGRVMGYELVIVTRQGRRITVSFNTGVCRCGRRSARHPGRRPRDQRAKAARAAAARLAGLHALPDRVQHRCTRDNRPGGCHHRREPADGGAHRAGAQRPDRV
jgi:PAS domain S-box-containing protein